jgi:hypothetical protein
MLTCLKSPVLSSAPAYLDRAFVTCVVPDLLRWAVNPNAATERLAALQHATACEQLSTLCRSGRLSLSVVNALSDLSSAQHTRILLAPVVNRLLFYELHDDNANLTDALGRYISLERYLSDPSTRITKGGWTALGDCYIQDGSETPPPLLRPTHWRSETLHMAREYRGIILDGCSPFLRSMFLSTTSSVECFSVDDFSSAIARVSDSLRSLRSLNSLAGSFVERSLKVIALARTPASPHEQLSSSRRDMLGIATLSNVTSQRWSTMSLADSLLHEAIHSFLFRLEMGAPFHPDYALANDIMVASPWSGKPLPLSAYVHACFVWFGLWSIWKGGDLDDPEVRQLAFRSQRGFLADPLLELYDRRADQQINTDVMTVLRSFVTEVSQQRI